MPWTHTFPDVAQLSKSHGLPDLSTKFNLLLWLCVQLFESTEEFLLIKTGKGPMQICFHQRRCHSCSEEQELHPACTIHLTTLEQNKIRKPVIIGSVSSHNIFPCHQCQLLPPPRETSHPCIPSLTASIPPHSQRCCRQMSFPGGCFCYHQLTYPTPR